MYDSQLGFMNRGKDGRCEEYGRARAGLFCICYRKGNGKDKHSRMQLAKSFACQGSPSATGGKSGKEELCKGILMQGEENASLGHEIAG